LKTSFLCFKIVCAEGVWGGSAYRKQKKCASSEPLPGSRNDKKQHAGILTASWLGYLGFAVRYMITWNNPQVFLDLVILLPFLCSGRYSLGAGVECAIIFTI